MNKHLISIITKATGAERILTSEVIQKLWSGYGEILRVDLKGAEVSSVVVKHVQLAALQHQFPKSDFSHNRKLRSYQVETEWYYHYSHLCSEFCKVPKCLAIDTENGDVVIIVEDLDKAGFAARKHSVNWMEMQQVIAWLADFHATFLGIEPGGLWETGTYWHLETRPEELACLDDIPLRNAAAAIDAKLKSSRFQTFVHGDAKFANFCFTNIGEKVAAVDFQYVGGGVGVKDLAYFVCSCLDDSSSGKLEKQILDYYFSQLKASIFKYGKNINPDDVEVDWRSLYPIAWTDFYRFYKGWTRDNWSQYKYSERISIEVIYNLEKENR